MPRRLRSWLEQVGESLSLIPALLVAVSVGGAVALVWVDRGERLADLPLQISVNAVSARTLLSIVAAATVTVAGIVFAMTAVTVQLASSQYSPRILRGLFRDRFQQVVIGTTAGTFSYCLVVSATLPEPFGAEETRSSLAVTIGVVLGVVAQLLIVAFIDRVLRHLRADEMIRRVTGSTAAVPG